MLGLCSGCKGRQCVKMNGVWALKVDANERFLV